MSTHVPYHMQDRDSSADGDTQEYNDVMNIGYADNDPSTRYSDYASSGKGLATSAAITSEGRIGIDLNFHEDIPELPESYARDVKEFAVDKISYIDCPPLNIVIMIVGSRGDVQPFLALAKRLQQDGHRVRIATHETFHSFVKDTGVEFFSIGGDPHELMSYMVKNPGLLPGFESLTNGDIGRKRKMLAEIFHGCWHACIDPDSDTGRKFSADAIISNPPAFAHVHIAECLGIPLLLSFTMPWSPTTSFPHPLVNVKQSNAERRITNYLSYGLADNMTWQGTGDVINRFRTKTLRLSPLTFRSGPGLVDRLKIPWTYCMSPTLIPKPKDWRNYIDVVGFYFLELGTSYTPADDLLTFLESGPPPVYIGFGSVVVEDPATMTDTIFSAVSKAGTRALVSAGWGGLGGKSIPDNIFILGNVPHDWLFTKVSAVVHHGGAGTTAIGLRLGKPTVIVPFFGDQPFWGAMVAKAGAGPDPIPHKSLNADNLADAIKFCLTPQALASAQEMGKRVRHEDGVSEGVKSFYRHLPLENMRCDLDPTRVAVWFWDSELLKLSAFAAQILVENRKLHTKDLVPHRSKEYDSRKIPTEPLTGGATEILRTISHYQSGIMEIFSNPVQGIINTTVAIPKGVYNIVGAFQEGLVNLPALYGSEVRQPGKIEGFTDGLKEAGKGFYFGYYDGIKGLVADPVKGGKKEGLVGAIKGSARSFVNVTMKPAAGGLGLVVHPAQGAWKSIQKNLGQDKAVRHVDSWIVEGREAARKASTAERTMILEAFDRAVSSKGDRTRRLGEAAVEAVQEPEIIPDGGSLAETSRSGAVNHSLAGESSKGLPPSYSPREEADWEAAFDRDMELAKHISLAEQRGYERGFEHGASSSN